MRKTHIFFKFKISSIGTHIYIYIYIYTGCPRRNGQNFGRVFLRLNYTDITQKIYIYVYRHTYIYIYTHTHRLLRGRTVSVKLPKIPLFGPSSIYRLRLLGSQQRPQSGVLFTSFSTWRTENSLVEINLESTGVGKGL